MNSWFVVDDAVPSSASATLSFILPIAKEVVNVVALAKNVDGLVLKLGRLWYRKKMKKHLKSC